MKSLGIVALTLVFGFLPASAGNLDLESRVAAQQSIDRFYFEHLDGEQGRFEDRVPPEVSELKVVESLKKSAALVQFWGVTLDSGHLQRELDRIEENTLFPSRLHDLYSRLGNDPVLIGEMIARPVLVQRLLRNRYAYDPAIHADALRAAEQARAQVLSGDSVKEVPGGNLTVQEIRIRPDALVEDPNSELPGVWYVANQDEFEDRVSRLPSEIGKPGVVRQTQESFEFTVVLERSADMVRYAEYQFMKIPFETWWRSQASGLDIGSINTIANDLISLPGSTSADNTIMGTSDCVADDTWDNGMLDDMTERAGHTIVWTGSEAIVYGGHHPAQGEPHKLPTGSRYDPILDLWTPITSRGAPVGRARHTAIWTGSEMIVWGGSSTHKTQGDGARYDPVADAWSPITDVDAPDARRYHSAVWTGTEMIIWGGVSAIYYEDGARYRPDEDRWYAMTTVDAPSARRYHSAIWTGSEMVVWGGVESSANGTPGIQTGGRYNPAIDSWQSTSLVDAPSARMEQTAVWSGDRMLLWGGTSALGSEQPKLNTGGRYDPSLDTWLPITMVNAPVARTRHVGVWTGSEMIIWGGRGVVFVEEIGGRYDPDLDSWTAMSTVGVPHPWRGQPGVWTGERLMVWGGGDDQGQPHNTGGLYDPALDAWSPTSMGPGPSGRQWHENVWTGSEMLIWGGCCPERSDGHRYDPVLDNWSPMSIENAPTGRILHAAVWTGTEMIVWGGVNRWLTVYHGSGGRYDPTLNKWSETSTAGIPEGKKGPAAVWTGSEMIVWSGVTDSGSPSDRGGAYAPATNSWRDLTLTNAPVARDRATAVWTGSEMIVWGGYSAATGSIRTGGRYNPVTDTWLPTALTGNPGRRYYHTAVWTGDRMIIWGGYSSPNPMNTGGLYDPVSNSWSGTSILGAPDPRVFNAYAWTGGELLVWGGSIWPDDLGEEYHTGGRYNPSTDTWMETVRENTPWARDTPPGVWTGEHFIIWGGDNGEYRTGGRYAVGNPDMDDDGASDECDCAVGDITAFELPGEVTHLSMSVDHATVTWYSEIGAGSGTVHDLLRGNLDELPVGSGSGETCIPVAPAEARGEDPVLPASGSGFWYLVRARNACGNGTYGMTSDLVERTSTICP